MVEPSPGPPAGVVLACERRPPSTNNTTGKGRDDFGAELEHRYEAVGRPKFGGEPLLYGMVCWFVHGYRPGTDPDADNISKGIWDLLCAPKRADAAGQRRLGAFQDDKQVRLRMAGIFDLASKETGAPLFEQLDLTGVPLHVIQRLGEMASGTAASRHLTYIRFGPLHGGMYKLTLPGEDP